MADFDREQLLKTWSIFRQPGEVLEMRIPKAGKNKTISGYFDDPEKFADMVVGLADEPFAGIYFTINPVKPDLMARAANRYVKYAETTTSDADIIALHWLPIDLDAKRPAGISATDEEHEAAITKCRDIRKWLIEDQKWAVGAFVLADSGNGGHLNVKIDMPNAPENIAIVKGCLEALDYIFSDDLVHVDTTSQNPARIWKLYGTTAKKGDSTPTRPHRLSKILETPDSSEIISKAQLEALAAMVPKEEKPPRTYSKGGFDPVAYCKAHGLGVHHTKSYKGGTLAVLDECVFDSSHKLSAVIGGWPNGMRTYRCRHHSCLAKHWKDARDVIEPNATARTTPTATTDIKLSDIATIQHYKDGNIKSVTLKPTAAARIVLEKMPIEMSVTSEEDIYHFNGAVYKPNGARVIDRTLIKVAGDAVTSNALKETLRRVRNELLESPVVFDPDPYLLGVQNGVIDLCTGEIRDYKPEDLVTDQIPVTHDPEARCPAFIGFLESITPNISDRITLIDWFVANAVRLPFAYVLFLLGLGRNGKNVYERLLKAFFGDGAFRDMSLGAVNKNEYAAGFFIGKRGWIASETGKHKNTIGTDFIKMTTGSGAIDTDRKNQARIRFSPYFQTIVDTNTMPSIDDNSVGWMERFVKADLPYMFVANPDLQNPLEKKKDPQMLQKLTTSNELSGILNLLLFRSKVIGRSEQIHKRPGSEMFAEYMEQSSSVRVFLENFCDYDDEWEIHTPTEPIYFAYKEWCGYKVGEMVDPAYFGKMIKKFCGGANPKRIKTADGKNVTTYRGLIFNNTKCSNALNEMKIVISSSILKDSQGNLKGSKETSNQSILISQGTQGNLWLEIKEKFGEEQTFTDPKSVSEVSETGDQKNAKGVEVDPFLVFPENLEKPVTSDTDLNGDREKTMKSLVPIAISSLVEIRPPEKAATGDVDAKDAPEKLLETITISEKLRQVEEQRAAKEDHFKAVADKYTHPEPTDQVDQAAAEPTEISKEAQALMERIYARSKQMHPNEEVSPIGMAYGLKANGHDIGPARCREWIEAKEVMALKRYAVEEAQDACLACIAANPDNPCQDCWPEMHDLYLCL